MNGTSRKKSNSIKNSIRSGRQGGTLSKKSPLKHGVASLPSFVPTSHLEPCGSLHCNSRIGRQPFIVSRTTPLAALTAWNMRIFALCRTTTRNPSSTSFRRLNMVTPGRNNSYWALQRVWPKPPTVDHFRPIVVMSMLYRAWSSTRACQILRQLGDQLDLPTYGFLPHREIRQAWLPIQAMIELCGQEDRPLLGYVSDIRKAFNHLPRRHVQALAHHAGLPRSFTKAWHDLLSSFERRFQVRDTVGAPPPVKQWLP